MVTFRNSRAVGTLADVLRRAAIGLIGIVVIASTASCSWVSSWFGDDDPSKPVAVSVFDAAVGDCFLAPAEVKAELPDLSKVPCDVAHQQELYAIVTYSVPEGTPTDTVDNYPGDAALDTYAQGVCAERFTDYVGLAYPDSGLWMTYLLPSARSWQQGKDRDILCFVTTTGGALTKSVKGSKL